MANITETAMLIKVSVGEWSGTKHDAITSAEVAEAKHASKRAGRYLKRLMTSPAMRDAAAVARQIDSLTKQNTCPWEDGGWRIMSGKIYFEFLSELGHLKREYEKYADRIPENWENDLLQAQADLGDLFRKEEFPTPEEVHARYYVKVDKRPIPTGGDFRVEGLGEEQDKIKEEIDRAVKAKLQTAIDEPWHRLHNVVTKFLEVVANNRRITEPLIENMKELVGVLPALNLNDDPHLAKIADDVELQLCSLDAGDLRDSSTIRLDAEREARKILEDMKTKGFVI